MGLELYHEAERTATKVALYGVHLGISLNEATLELLRSAQKSLSGQQEAQAKAQEEVRAAVHPKVPVKESVKADFLVCLEDGRKFKTLARHLHAAHGLTPEAYREKWGLSEDYPMMSAKYAAERSRLAKKFGGRPKSKRSTGARTGRRIKQAA